MPERLALPPLKYALSLLGLMSAAVRLALVEPADATKAEVRAVMASLCRNFGDYAIGKPTSEGRQGIALQLRDAYFTN